MLLVAIVLKKKKIKFSPSFFFYFILVILSILVKICPIPNFHFLFQIFFFSFFISTLVLKKSNSSQCLKITEKVAFNIASEASNVYILSGQKLNKNAKNGPFWRLFKNLKLGGQTVLPDRSLLNGKIGEKL